MKDLVTPCVGVWIEIAFVDGILSVDWVTPCEIGITQILTQ